MKWLVKCNCKIILPFMLLALLLGQVKLIAQKPKITSLEYFLDNDSGYGNGTFVSLTSDSVINKSFSIDLTNSSLGFHKLLIRVKDTLGHWSFTTMQDLFKVRLPDALPPTKDIVAMEYFFDTDPGFDNGTGLPLNSALSIDKSFVVNISGLTIGFHTLFLRVKDSDGLWSITDKRDLFKVRLPDALPPTTDIVAMEYFFDTDPGFNNGTSLALTSGLSIDENYFIDITSLSLGVHKLFLRTMDNENKWSMTDVRNVFKLALPNLVTPPQIVSMEYFVDEDPGFGNATPIVFTPNSLIDKDLIIDIAKVEVGMHFLFLRVKDDQGSWSLAYLEPFCVKGFQLNLEAAYDTLQGQMTTVLNDKGLLPLSQPFDSQPSADWYYAGSESVTSIPNEHIVDWLLIQARDATSVSNATPATIAETKAVFLLDNGKIVELDGSTPADFSASISDNLYVVIYHRNHLSVITSYPVTDNASCGLTYNFTSGANVVLGGDTGYKEIAAGIWGMVAGEGSGDGIINTTDLNTIWANDAGKSGYQISDYNMDGQTDNHDKNQIWIDNDSYSGAVPH